MAYGPSRVNVNEAAALYNSGWTLAQLGQKYGVTRERMRQKITALVDHDRPRVLTCKHCGSKFVCPSTTVKAELCSDECRRARRAAYVRMATRDKCKCGRTKYRVAKVCMHCTRTFDHSLAAYLYDHGATGLQVAKFLGVKQVTVHKVIEKLCVSHGMGFRKFLDDSELKGLARKYRKATKGQ